MEPAQALHEMSGTVERATALANQMLAMAKVEQLRQQGGAPRVDWAGVVRAVALDLSPLIAERHLDFELDAAPAPVRAHEWALRELTRNLLHNAIRHTPERGRLWVRLRSGAQQATLTVADSGPGIAAEQRLRLFQPFSAGDSRSGSGLGLAICHEIVLSLGGEIRLDNREQHGRVIGLDATVSLPLADNTSA